MKKKSPPPLTLDDLRNLYRNRRSAIRNRLEEFTFVQPEDYFYELAYCLLTPQSSAVNAGKVVVLLQRCDFLHADIDPEPFLSRKEHYIRFHKTKAKHLLALKKQYPFIAQHIADKTPSHELREWLVKHVKGLGWKEASHFLRNIGHRNHAILDRHILKNLVRIGAIRRIPATLTPKRYMQIERKFRTFAQHVGIPMDELDLLFWSLETGEILK